jgi:hypothetical protein
MPCIFRQTISSTCASLICVAACNDRPDHQARQTHSKQSDDQQLKEMAKQIRCPVSIRPKPAG